MTVDKTRTGAVERARRGMSSSARMDASRYMLVTGRPGTIRFAAREEPMNCSKRGIEELGREGEGGWGMVGMESSSSSRRDGVN